MSSETGLVRQVSSSLQKYAARHVSHDEWWLGSSMRERVLCSVRCPDRASAEISGLTVEKRLKPLLRHVANLWTLIGYPSRENEWTLERKLKAIREAGFDGVCWAPSPELHQGVRRHGLIFVGGMAPGSAAEFPPLLANLQRCGAHHVNVQLGAHDTPTNEALSMILTLMEQARRFGLAPAIESHRGTCTETPEKTYALADAYQQVTGELLPIAWDFSHFAVVKHLMPGEFIARLLQRPDLIANAPQFHFRPFNGHHVQVPITDSRGELTAEMQDWLPFAEAVLRSWLEQNGDSGREIFICPELGPIEGGYALFTFSDSWEDAKILREQIDRLWARVTSGVDADQAVSRRR